MDILLAHPWQMWLTLAVVAGAIIAYSLDRFSLELVSACTLVVLLLMFQVMPFESEGSAVTPGLLLSGFSSTALFAILGLLIIGQGMYQSGALEGLTQALLSEYEKRSVAVTVAVFASIFVVSAFLNNTPVVIMFVPIMAAIAAQNRTPASRLMMPLSFISILGGMTTLIGSSTNLLAAEAYRATTGEQLGFFSLTPLGLCLAGVGAVYVFTAGRFLVPHRTGPGDEPRKSSDGKQFIAQIDVAPDHPLVGKGAKAGLFRDLPEVTVRMILRGDQPMLPPFDEFEFQAGDTIIVAATRERLTKLLTSHPEYLAGVLADGMPVGDQRPPGSTELNLVEAIVAPGSRMIGRAIAQIGFRYQTNCVVLGIQRRSRMIRSRMNSIRLEAGDVLLILGEQRDLRALRSDRDLLLLEWSMTNLPGQAQARIAAAIFIAVVASAAIGLVPIVVAAIAGATAMVAFGCLNVRQAARAIDRRLFLLIGVALAMGQALEETGGAQLIGDLIVSVASGLGPAGLMSAVFLLSAAMTNVLSNNATAVLFAPIAVSAAQSAGIDPQVLILTVIFGANCSFATPVAYQTNLLVMAPGGYKFADFARVGGPLIALLWVFYTVAAPFYFRAVGLL